MDTFSVEELLNKYIYKSHHIGVSPRDRLRIPRQKRYAFVWNTDPHNKRGQHWVAVYIVDGVGYYFDSYGIPPKQREFVDFLNIHCKNWKYNSRRIQDKFSAACGHFCVYFLIHMSYHCEPTSIVDNLLGQSDDKVVKFVQNLYCK